MKFPIKSLIATSLAVSVGFFATLTSKAQTTLLLDPTQPFQGFMNIFDLPSAGGGYQFDSSWGTTDLKAYYDAHTNILTITPCTNVWETTDTYWVQADGITPNKVMDANYYVDFAEPGAGVTYTFSGYCISNTLNSGYSHVAFIKEFTSSYNFIAESTTTTTSGVPFSISYTTTQGAGARVQYGFETEGPDADPTNLPNLGVAIYQIQYPSLELSALTSQALVEGQTASFTETPSGSPPFSYQWTLNGTPLVNGNGISGATTNVLTIANLTAAESGALSVNVTNSIGSNAVVFATLAVIPLVQAETNYCIDPSFESDTFAPASTAGWFNYGGAAFANTNEFYSDFDPSEFPDVSVIDGTNCLVEYSGGAGSYTGVYQDRPAQPGQVYTASAWFFTPTAIQGYDLVGAASANLQIQFHDINGNLLVDYESAPFTTNAPQDTWMNMPVTNEYANDFVTVLGTGPLIVSPPGTASMRIQPGYHAVNAADGGDIYIDMVDVTLHESFAVPSLTGTTFKLTFPTVYGPQYNVMYRTNLLSGSWQMLTSVTGDGTVKTVTDTVGNVPRFYVVNTSP